MSLPSRASAYRIRTAVLSQLACALECIVLCIAIVIASQASGEPRRGKEEPPVGPTFGAPAPRAFAKLAKRQHSDRVLVRFKKGASRSEHQVALGHAGVSPRKHFRRSGVSVLHILPSAC